MILRECYFGAKRFEHFQRILGLPRTTLSNRLQRLVKYGLLDAQLYMASPPRRDYRLSESGKALYPVLLSLMTFGDRWLSGADEKPLQLIHTVCNAPCSAIVVCPHCRKEIAARDVSYRDGPGAGLGPVPQDRNSRRTSDPTALERKRPSSVARTYKVIGDRWSFRILRAAFFKFRRFDELQVELESRRDRSRSRRRKAEFKVEPISARTMRALDIVCKRDRDPVIEEQRKTIAKQAQEIAARA